MSVHLVNHEHAMTRSVEFLSVLGADLAQLSRPSQETLTEMAVENIVEAANQVGLIPPAKPVGRPKSGRNVKTKVYLAARFPRREEMEQKANELAALSKGRIKCVARWVFGGEDGLTRPQIADLDLEDVAKADELIIFTHKHGSKQPGGGRFVEMGYAMALGKRVVVIGDYENVFTYHNSVKVYPDWDTYLRAEVPV